MAIAKKITINDVALAAGVSVSTVSLVLSGKGRISSATGERVNQAIEQLGFVRNRQAASLRGGQSGVIGLIVSDLSKPFYAELTAGLTDAREAGENGISPGEAAAARRWPSGLIRWRRRGGRGDYRRGDRPRERAARACGGGGAAGVCFPRQLS
ncbi:hypothetical protein KPZU09_17080 [Klebsiella pneumoniae]|uniref:HTH lacI-type domain-containing protein n=1 Tax=Klebsiella pneumoniae TaxID=573 RepID=A0A919LY06_KLEPN|nr:hypothetical protein KPZU09_17080 [Klebsiella pneumoniae]